MFSEFLRGTNKCLINWFWTTFTSCGRGDDWYSQWAKWSVAYRWESYWREHFCPTTFLCSFLNLSAAPEFFRREGWNAEGECAVSHRVIRETCRRPCWAFQWTDLETAVIPGVSASGRARRTAEDLVMSFKVQALIPFQLVNLCPHYHSLSCICMW